MAESRAFLCDGLAPDAPHSGGCRAREGLSEARRWRTEAVSLDEAIAAADTPSQDFVALDDALNALEAVDPRKCKVVEMRFFGEVKRGGDGGGASSLGWHCQARLAAGESMVGA